MVRAVQFCLYERTFNLNIILTSYTTGKSFWKICNFKWYSGLNSRYISLIGKYLGTITAKQKVKC